ncbi:MAG: hypothetical protein WA634_07655 [Silvibacterium sp.]
MNTRKVTAWGMVLLACPFMSGYAFADASYQSTTQITGGTLVDTVKSVGFLGKSMSKMFAPTSTLTMVHGNQKATVSKDFTDIVDLDKEEMIHIDSVKKTYTVMTFAQMRQMMQNMPQQMQKIQAQAKQAQTQQPQTDLKMSYNVSAKNTGVSKEVNGLMAQEQVITMTMTITDPNAPAPAPGQPTSIAYTVTTDAWIAPDPPEVKEIQDFDIRMGQKIMQGVDMQAWAAQMKASANNAGMGQLLGGQPGAADAMAQMGKEMAKLKGTRVLEITSMGGLAPAGTAPASSTTPAAQTNSGSVAGQVATDTATQTAATESSRLGTVGSALGSSMMSAWHRKKAQPAPAPAPAPAAATPANGQATQNVVMMSMTTQKTNFSKEQVPVSAFEIPAGYKQVTSPLN